MLIGKIAMLDSEKGIGFITPCAPGGDVFFHCSVVAEGQFEQLRPGQAVAFDLEPVIEIGARPRAAKVAPCDPKLLGRRGGVEAPPSKHPRSRRRKPTWRK